VISVLLMVALALLTTGPSLLSTPSPEVLGP
jgi:hypothetical protein